MALLGVNEFRILAGAVLFTSLLSLIGTSLVLLSFFIFRGYRKRVNRLVAALSLTDFMSSLTFVISACVWLKNGPSTGSLCLYEAWSLEFFVTAAAFWALCISIYLFLRVIYGKTWKWRLEIAFHVISWGVPLILSIPPFFGPPKYGPAGVWCWITADPVYSRWVLYYMYIFAIMVIICIIYGILIYYIKKRLQSKEQENDLRKVIVRVAAYPLAFVIVWVPGLINRMQNSIDPTNQYLSLFFLHLFFVPLQGFLNALAYGWNENLLKRYKRLILQYLAKKYAQRFSDILGSDLSTTDTKSSSM